MTIDAINNVAQQVLAAGMGNPASGIRQSTRSLELALLNGNVSGAQSAFASLQQAAGSAQVQSNAGSVVAQLGQSSTPLGMDMQALATALNGNDLTGAQGAFAKLQQDMRSAFQANATGQAQHVHRGHHRHDQGGFASPAALSQSQSPATASNASDSAAGSDVVNALQSLASANPKVATDLANLLKDLNSTGGLVNTTA